jgi:DedD protein
MALFKFRKGRDEPPAPAPKAPTVEAVRRRAMHRLIGAAVLVLAGVIGFPLVFDNQPRPISVDLPIEIVDKSRVKPLVLPSAPPASGVMVAAPGASAQAPAQPPEAAPTPTVVAPVDTATAAPAAPKTPTITDEKSEVRSLDAKKARALLEARPLRAEAAGAPAKAPAVVAAKPPAAAEIPAAASAKTAASDDRFVVQVGAFADASKVREVRRKVEAAGLKTYTQVVSTSEGDRTRVRVGPFTDRADADKAAEKIRQLKLAAAVLTL